VVLKIFSMLALATGLTMAQGPEPAGTYLGVWVWEIDAARRQELKLPHAGGVEITRVRKDSPADQAGLKAGDVVMQYNARRVEGIEQFSQLVRDTAAGQSVKLQVFRNGAAQEVTAKIAATEAPRVSGAIVTPRPIGPFPDMPRTVTTWRNSFLGMDTEALEGQLAEFFGVAQGVLIRAVLKGSAAEKAGLRAGDVIVRVNGGKVATPSDLSTRVRASEGNSAAIVIVRDHKEMTISAQP
jgi:serine protease Do